jgi:hypothetical protein
VDIVFTEDSDLVAYGCPTVLFKLDKFGDAQELRLADVLDGPPEARRRLEEDRQEERRQESVREEDRRRDQGQEREEGQPSGGSSADGGSRGGEGDAGEERLATEAVNTGATDNGGDDDDDGGGGGDRMERDEDDDEIAVTTGSSRRGRGRGRGGGTGSGRQGCDGPSGAATQNTGNAKAAGSNAPSKGAAAKGPLNFAGWDRELFLGLCVLSGCDFLPNVRGIGIKKAHALVARHRSIKATLAVMHGDRKIAMPTDYDRNFQRAYWTFCHARVYDPQLRRLRPLTPMPAELEGDAVDTSFLGRDVDAAAAVEVAEGRLDPITRRPFVVPPSPQKQRGWAPRGGQGRGRGGGAAAGSQQQWGGGGHGWGGGGGGAGSNQPPPKARATAFVNLFGGVAKAMAKSKTISGLGGGDGGDDSCGFGVGTPGGIGGNLEVDLPQAAVDDDAAMAAMMEDVERSVGSGAASKARGEGDDPEGTNAREMREAAIAAIRQSEPEAEAMSTPAHGTKQARESECGGAAGTSWVPAAYAVAPDSSARSDAASPGSAARGGSGSGGGAENEGEEEEDGAARNESDDTITATTTQQRGVEQGLEHGRSQRPTWLQSAAAVNAPANKFARIAPARKPGGNGLSSLFDAYTNAHAGEQPRPPQQVQVQHQAPPPQQVRDGETLGTARFAGASIALGTAPFAKLGVGGGGGNSGVVGAAPVPQAKKGTMQSFFPQGPGAGGAKRAADGAAAGGGNKVWSIAELSRRSAGTKSVAGKRKKR